MIEIYSAFVRTLLRRLLEAANLSDVPVVYSHSVTLDAQMVQKRHQAQMEEEKRPTGAFVAFQQTPAPEVLPRYHPNKPGFHVAKKYKAQGVFLGAEATFVSVPYQVRYYLESEVQKYAVLESLLVNYPRLGSYGAVRIYFLEDHEVTVSFRFENQDYDRELEATLKDQFQYHVLVHSIILEAPVFGKPFAGKLLLRPVILFEDPELGVEEIQVEFEGE